jgi:hypothetical protein
MAEGYLFVDHRASPGLSEDVALRAGYDPLMCKEGKVFEAVTKQCKHCGTPVMLSPTRKRPRNYCMKCGGAFICDICAFRCTLPDYVHTPIVKVVDLAHDAEAKGQNFDPMRLIRGSV